MEDSKIREILDQSNANSPYYPENVRDIFGDMIEEIEFDEQDGIYTVWLETDECYETCAMCGHRQPMNIKAMEEVDSDVAEEMRKNDEKPRWDNNTCETRHPPFDPGW